MKRGLTAWTMVAALSAGVAMGAEVFSVNTVGAMKIPITGGNQFNLVSIPMHKLPVDFGTVTANDATSISDGAAGWTADQFKKGVTGVEATGGSTFYIEITSGAHEGRHFYVESNTVSKLVITGGVSPDVTAGALVGATYKVVPAHRVRDIFGEPGSTVIAGANSQAAADLVITWGGVGFASAVWFNIAGGSPATHNQWRQGAANANDVVIDRDAGLFVHKKSAGDTNLTVTGEVSGNAQKVVLALGFNLVGGLSVIDPAVTNANLNAAMQGAGSQAAADLMIPWAGSGYASAIWYNDGTGGSPAIHNTWRQGSSNAGGLPVKAATGYFIQKRNTSQIWNRPSPL